GRGRPGSPACPLPGARVQSEIPCCREKFPANSLLGCKKFPAPARREFFRKTLESVAFLAPVLTFSAGFPANSLPAGNFSLLLRALGQRPGPPEPGRQHIEFGAVGAAGLGLDVPDGGELPLEPGEQLPLCPALQHLGEEEAAGRENVAGESAEPFAQPRRRVRVVEIHRFELDPLDRVHLEEIDGDHPPPALSGAGPGRRDLAPATRRGAEVEDALAGPEEFVFLVDLQKLVGRARPVALAPGLRHIGVVELALEPQRRGKRALAGGLHARLQRPAALAARAAAAHRRRSRRCAPTPSSRIRWLRIPSRRPRSAMRSRSAGKRARIASRMAQPASTRSARSWPIQALAARSA